MKRLIPALLLLTFLLGACSTSNSPTESSSAPTTESSTSETSREAVLSDVENDVKVRVSSNEEFTPASNGTKILPGGSIETGENGRAKIQLQPDGTIVRLAPSSSFSIPALTTENGQPKTTIQLLFGKVFILLNGGSLEVQTPNGVASVRGSLLSVQYDPEKNRVEAACLEGHCALEDENGDEVELIEGQSSFVEGDEDPSDPEMIDREDIQDWLDENPELSEFMDELPDPEDYPEDIDEEENTIDDESTENESETESGNEEEDDNNDDGGDEPESWIGSFYNI